jgi:hypothetical protein
MSCPILDLAACREGTRRSTGQESALRVILQRNLAWNDQCRDARSGIGGAAVRDALEIQILARAAQGSLLAHHAGDLVRLLTRCALFVARALAVFKATQPLLEFLAYLFLQAMSMKAAVSRYSSSRVIVKSTWSAGNVAVSVEHPYGLMRSTTTAVP